MTANGLLVHFAGSSLHFKTRHPDLLSALETHFRHCLGSGGGVLAEYEITPAADGQFAIARDGSQILTQADLPRALAQLMQDGLTQLNGASHTHLVFHAAALAFQEQGLVLCGRTGSGKSTLAAGLVAGGFQYLTDEVIAWPAQGEDQISGFCRSIALKRGSRFIWERWGDQQPVQGLLCLNDGGAWIASTLLNPAAVRASAAPRLLLFPRFAAESPLQAEPLTSGEALFQLLQCLVNARNFADGGMEAAARLARSAPAFRLAYSNWEDVHQWILQRMQTG